MAKNKLKNIGKRRAGWMALKRNAIIEQRKHILRLKQKLADGTATVIDGQIITVPYKEMKLK